MGKLIDAGKLLSIINESADAEHEQWEHYDDEVAFGAMNAYGRVIEVIKHMKGENPCNMCRFTFYEKEGMSDEQALLW